MRLFYSNRNIFGCATALLLLPAHIATADSTISWAGAQPIAGDNDVATTGVLSYAEHWGGTDATVNGVPFTAAGVQVVPSITPGINGNIGAPSGLSPAYQNILRGNWYDCAGRTATLMNLTAGQTYLVQVWVCDIRYSPSQTTSITGGPSLGIKAGHYTVGTFTADGTTQQIWFGGDGVVNAVMVRNISGTTVGPVSATNSTVIASPAAIPADGVTTTTITVTLRDSNNLPVSGKTVTLTSSRGGADTISAASGPSSSVGVVAFTVNSTNTGMAMFSAVDVTDGNLALTQTATVSVTNVGLRAQASPNPIVFDQTATNDNLVVLMAAASEHSDSLSLLYSGPSVYPKHFWFANFNSPSQFMKWNVSLATGAVYRVYAKLSAGALLPLQLSVTGTNTTLNFTTRNNGWDKLDCGTISIPAGTSQLLLRRNTTNTTDPISIISLELLRESDRPAYEQRVADFRADTTWLSQSKYGLMTQFGPWGYPPSGPQVPFETWINGFNVTNFVNLVTNTGAKYVIWSLTWWTYQICAPITNVDNILGHSNRTATRDLIGELATALRAADVRFMLYYHCGQDSHLGYNSTDWWQTQQWPDAEHTERGVGDRSRFFTNWVNVISEIGNRYGTNLDGWFFDDAQVSYYPAPFERMGQAAKAGNPNRLVSYNAWIATRSTDFQEVWMGEGYHGESQFGSATAGGDGVFTDGPQQGLLEHAMFVMEQDWGVHKQNQPINTGINASQAIGWVQSAGARGVPLSFNMMLWSDQTYSTSSLNVLLNLKSAIYGSTNAPTNNLVVNGGFENPVMPNWAPYPAGNTSLTGWTIDATPSDGVQLGRAGIFSANNGSQNLQLTGGSTYAVGGGISQTIITKPGRNYTISVDVASRNGSAVTGNFNFGGSNHVLNTSSTAFTTLTWQAVATGTNTLINITGYTNSASRQLIIDNVLVSENPDPFAQWQMNYFSCTNCQQAQADADPLGKGMDNYAQFLAGLNPTNPASVLAITSAVRQGGDLKLTWKTAGPRTNILQVSYVPGTNGFNFSDLPASLTVIHASGDATANYVDVGALSNSAARYYRVRLAM